MRKIPFHPFLLGIYPALAMLASNVSQVEFGDTVRVFYASILIIILVVGVFQFIIRDWRKSALVASSVLLFFFSYGHVYSLLRGLSIGPVLIGRTLVLLPLYLLIVAACTWWTLARLRDAFRVTEILNWVSLFLLSIPLYTVTSYYIRAEMIRASQPVVVPVELAQRFDGEPPNIYYIVLDMHARSDVLQTIYGYDNTWFTNALQEMGFYVAEQSTSNYSSTLQSISSSLNMEYINYLQEEYGPGSNNREPLGILLDQNKVMQLMKEAGYKIGAFESNDFHTEFREADEYIKPTPDQIRRYQNFWSLNSFEGIFLQSTVVGILYDLGIVTSETAIEKTIETPYRLHRLIILNAVNRLPEFAKEKEPYFVFAHLLSPHPPYVFGRNGEEVPQDRPFSLSGPARQNGGAEYMKLYVDQLHYIDTLILEAVERILSDSETPPIILLQGDHGPVSYFGEDEVMKSNMKEQHAILNAYYFPGQAYELLYPTITPVNSFRVVINTFFGGDYELLPDQNYFLPHARPFDFVDVTERVQSDPLIP